MCMSGKEYDAWKRKCALEKKEREATRNNESSVIRVKQHSTRDNNSEAKPYPACTGGRYVILPTIPPIKALVDTNGKIIALFPAGKKEKSPWSSVRGAPVASTSSSNFSSASPSAQSPLPPALPAPTVSPDNQFSSSAISCEASSSSNTVLHHPPPPPALSLIDHPPAPSLTDICAVLQSMPTSLLLEQRQNGISIFNSMPWAPDLTKSPVLPSTLDPQTCDLYKLPPPPAIAAKCQIFQYKQYSPYSIQSQFSTPSLFSHIPSPTPQQDFGELSREIQLLLNRSLVQHTHNR